MSEFEQTQETVENVEPTTVAAVPQQQGEYTRIIGLYVANSTHKIWTD